MRKSRPSSPVPGALIANKVDLRDSRRGCVETKEGVAFATAKGLQYFEVSASDEVNVEKPFRFCADLFIADTRRGLSKCPSLRLVCRECRCVGLEYFSLAHKRS